MMANSCMANLAPLIWSYLSQAALSMWTMFNAVFFLQWSSLEFLGSQKMAGPHGGRDPSKGPFEYDFMGWRSKAQLKDPKVWSKSSHQPHLLHLPGFWAVMCSICAAYVIIWEPSEVATTRWQNSPGNQEFWNHLLTCNAVKQMLPRISSA